MSKTYGFPSLSRMTPLGSFVIPFASLDSSVDELAVAGVWWGNRFFGRPCCDSEADIVVFLLALHERVNRRSIDWYL